MTKRNSTAALALIAVMSLPGVSGCGGDPAGQEAPRADLAALSATGSILSVYANDAFAQVNGQVQLTTVVTASGTIDRTVTWSLDPTALGTITPTGLYTAPSVAGKYTAWATSNADPTKKDYCFITVTLTSSGSIARVYANDASVTAGQSVQLTTVVTASGTIDRSVTWSLDPVALGTLTPQGLYTAPSSPGTYKAWATSNADPTKKDYCWISVTSTASGYIARVYANDASVTAGQSVQLTTVVTASGTIDRSITWSLDPTALGTITPEGLYTAPSTNGTYKAWATSVADPTKKDYCFITVSSTDSGSISRVYANDASVTVGQSVQLTTVVTASGTIDKSVTWSLDPTALGTITPQGRYTAPSNPGTYKAWATSVADPTKKDYCWISVESSTPPPPPPPPPSTDETLAFPGCEGAGCDSVGGRGGAVIKVTNLNDSGPGSLRACVNASGPRTCVFTVGGKIQTTSEMRVTNPYLTIAGQTAPGGGIEVVGKMQGHYVFVVATHDVTVRYVRFFNDAHPACEASSQGCGVASMLTPAHNVVLDHLTAAYTQDENLTVWSGGPPGIHNVTVSWVLNAYPLVDHPTGTVIAGASPADSAAMTDIDFHHNYYASVGHRTFAGGAKGVRWAYNIVLNYGWYALRTGGGITNDVVGNIYRCGSQTDCSYFPFTLAPEWNFPVGSPSLYLHNNVWKTKSNDVKVAGDLSDASQWPLSVCMVQNSSVSASCTGTAPTSYRRATPIAASALGSPIANGYSFEVARDGSNLETALLDTASAGDALRATPYGPVGASRQLDCNGNLVNSIDGLLQRAILEYVGGGSSTYAPPGGSRYPATQTDICWAPGQCGIPTLAAGAACADADGDGMPDEWETHWGLNASSAGGEDGPNGHKLSSSYTNLEMYLNGFKGF